MDLSWSGSSASARDSLGSAYLELDLAPARDFSPACRRPAGNAVQENSTLFCSQLSHCSQKMPGQGCDGDCAVPHLCECSRLWVPIPALCALPSSSPRAWQSEIPCQSPPWPQCPSSPLGRTMMCSQGGAAKPPRECCYVRNHDI